MLGTQRWSGVSPSSAGWQPGPWPPALAGLCLLAPWHSRCRPCHPESSSGLRGFPKSSLTGENVFLWRSLERQIPFWSAVCRTSAGASLCVSVSLCSMSLLSLLCSKYSSFNEAKFFNYYFSLWNGSWSLGLLILSDWKGKKNLLNNFLTPSRGFLSKPRNNSAVGEAEHSVTAPAQPPFSADYVFPSTHSLLFSVSCC